MKIAVTGGAGYVGSVLCPLLNYASVEKLTIIDTFWFWDSIESYRLSFEDPDSIFFVKSDIRDNLNNILEDHDVVINLACISNDISSDLDPHFTHDVSYNGVMNVIKTCELLGIPRIIQLSSGSVYGVQEKPVKESSIAKPITQYAQIKLEIDHYLKFLMKNSNHDVTILRPATVYGFSPRQRLDLMLNIFADKVNTDKQIVVHGGQQSRPAININDLCDVILQILSDPKSYNEIYNVSKEAMCVKDYAALFKRLYPFLDVVVEGVEDARSWRTDSEKLYRDLGIVHPTNLSDGIEELVASLHYCRFNRDKSQNIKVMKDLLDI